MNRTFPEVFGLKAWPGMKFCIDEKSSYKTEEGTILYISVLPEKILFSKATVKELEVELVELVEDNKWAQ